MYMLLNMLQSTKAFCIYLASIALMKETLSLRPDKVERYTKEIGTQGAMVLFAVHENPIHSPFQRSSPFSSPVITPM